jgi:hypothetical protein
LKIYSPEKAVVFEHENKTAYTGINEKIPGGDYDWIFVSAGGSAQRFWGTL